MSEIKKELWKLSEKMEIEGRSSTIAGQINIMNRALDGQPGLDIADSIKKHTEVAGGSATLIEKEITENGTYNAADDEADGYSQVVIDVTPPSNEFYPNVRAQVLMTQNTIAEEWLSKTWTGLTNFDGSNVWTDGNNIYYSNGSDQYVLDKSISTWSEKTWEGLTTNFYGNRVWTDGTNIYYSNGSYNYILDKTTSTWNNKSWDNHSIDGRNVWTDGSTIYYSDSSSQYIIDTSTSTLSNKTWSGLTNFYGEYIWTDGDNIYYSEQSGPDYYRHYVLNKSTSTWSTKVWSGFTKFSIYSIWTDGSNVYCSKGSTHYVLDKTSSTWIEKTWSGLTNFYGDSIWTDGTNIYYSKDSNNYYTPIIHKSFPKISIYNN